MGILSRLTGAFQRSTASSDRPASWLVDWMRGGASDIAGISVTPKTAMQTSAVWACVRVRSEDIGKLPTFLYRRRPDGGKERATRHPLFNLIRNMPNSRQTAFEFKQMLQLSADLHGNGYALKEYDEFGRVGALWPLDPTKVVISMTPDGKDLFYSLDRGPPIPSEGIFHLRGFSQDGIYGMSPIAEHRETIGLSIAARKYGSAFFGNSAMPRGGVKVPTTLSTEAAAALRASWESRYKGVEKSNQVAIFDGGMEWMQMGMNNTDAQYLELRELQNRDIWRIYRVPAHKVGDLTKSTNNNIEHQALEYVTDCLLTEMVRWEQTLSRDLLTETERKAGYFFEFLPDALLRGDQKSRYEAYAIGRNWGWLSVNDIRQRENLNDVEDGDIFLQPLNMVEAGTPPAPQTAPATPVLPTPGAKAALDLLIKELSRAAPEAPLLPPEPETPASPAAQPEGDPT